MVLLLTVVYQPDGENTLCSPVGITRGAPGFSVELSQALDAAWRQCAQVIPTHCLPFSCMAFMLACGSILW
jgi:hypothetical protein